VRLAYLSDPVFGTPELDLSEYQVDITTAITNESPAKNDVIQYLGSISFKDKVIPSEEAKNLVEYKVDPDSINIDRRGPQDEVYKAQQQILGQRGQGGGLLGNLFAETFTQNPAKIGENLVAGLGEGVLDALDAGKDLKNQILGKGQKQAQNTESVDPKQIEQIRKQQILEMFTREIESKKRQVEVENEIKEGVRHETAGMSTEQKAKEAGMQDGYQKTENISTRAWITLKKLWKKVEQIKAKISPFNATKKRIDYMGVTAKDTFNRAGESFGSFTRAAG